LIEDTILLERIVRVVSKIGKVASVSRLIGDASSRIYFRTIFQDAESAIAMVLPNPGANEEATFIEIQKYLKNLGILVPSIIYHDLASGVLVLEDLGDDLLENVVSRSEIERFYSLYRLAVNTLIYFQERTSMSESSCSAFSIAFDEAKLMQEMDFFVTHFVKGWGRKNPSSVVIDQMNSFFEKLCRELATQPRMLTHRDYHSRNLIMKHNCLYMIDFQDARMGPAQYDLASLLRDSYLSLPEDLVDSLLNHYLENAVYLTDRDYDHFRRIFDLMSLQRNIKALGTFGYQASVRGSSRYLSAIPRTATSISRNLRKYPEFRGHLSVLQEYILGPALSI